MPATKTQIIGGSFQNSDGALLALGFLTMELSQDEQAPGAGQVGFGVKVTVPLDSSGNVSGTVSVWANDILLPVSSYYTVNAFTAKGQLAWGPQYQTVLNGVTFDLGTWVPNSLSIVNSGGGSTGVTSLNTETGAINILAGANVTVTSSGQNITVAASTSAAPLIVQTNGVSNASQLALNLVAGTNITLTNTSGGNVTIDATSGIAAGNNVVMGWTVTNLGSGSPGGNRNLSYLTKLYSHSLLVQPGANAWKIRMGSVHSIGSMVIGGMSLLTTLANSDAVIATTPVTIGGLGAQTLALNTGTTFFDTDPINVALDTNHNYTFVFYLDNDFPVGPNVNVNVQFFLGSIAANVGMLQAQFSGDQTGISTLPAESNFLTGSQHLTYQVVTV